MEVPSNGSAKIYGTKTWCAKREKYRRDTLTIYRRLAIHRLIS